MALVKCGECKKEISSKAKECPNCGSPVKSQTRIGCSGLFLIFAILVIFSYIAAVTKDPAPNKKLNPKKTKITINKKDFKDSNWPFTVNSGTLECRNDVRSKEVIFHANGKTYSVNGAAKTNKKYSDWTEILRRRKDADPSLSFDGKGLLFSSSEIIEKGLSLCSN